MRTQDLFKRLSSPTYNIPLDVFRIGVGLLSFVYFLRSLFEAPYFMGKESLINHQMVQKIFWYTWQPLFSSEMSSGFVQGILGISMVMSLLLVIGLHTRLMAFLLYLIVVCSYRFHFLVFFVDDVVMHLLLFWCFVLPTGKTLTLLPWLKDRSIQSQWLKTKTDGFTLNLFLYNIALIYFVAGISKFTSPLWLEGVALLAVLKLPMGWFAQFHLENHEALLKFANYIALLCEPLFAMIIFLKPWNRLKLFLGVALAFFHLFIIATLDVPMANIGCLILAPILFHQELMDLILKKKRVPTEAQALVYPQKRWAKAIALFTVIFLTGSMGCSLMQNQWRSARSSSAETGGKIQTFFYSGLWSIGLAQGYRLLDWIDERNFHQVFSIHEQEGENIKNYSRSELVPLGMRGSLILSYISDITWMYVAPEHIEDVRVDIKRRLSDMYCRERKNKTAVEVWQALTRIDSFAPDYQKPELLLKFTCENFKTSVI